MTQLCMCTPRNAAVTADSTHRSQEADSLAHERRNRYFNVVPFDRNRVRLRGGGQDYINASLLGSAEGEPAPWHYIATQARRRGLRQQHPVSRDRMLMVALTASQWCTLAASRPGARPAPAVRLQLMSGINSNHNVSSDQSYRRPRCDGHHLGGMPLFLLRVSFKPAEGHAAGLT